MIDNNVLANFLDAGQAELLQKAQVVFGHFLIPLKVKEEFLNVDNAYLPQRLNFLQNVTSETEGFYRLCTTYDLITLGIAQSLVSSGLDSGEAEAIAQARKRNVKFFLTDDKDCTEIIKREFGWLLPMRTFALIAMLEIHGLIPNAVETWRFFHSKVGFTHEQLKQAVRDAFSILGVRPDKTIFSELTSWKRIFGHPPKRKTSSKVK